MDESLQDRYGRTHRCFGCGPANPDGLHVKSRVEGDTVVADWTPQPRYEAFENALSGGICGTLLDCHSNWTAAWHLMRAQGLDAPPSTVTAEFHVKLRAPTPTDGPVHLVARVVESSGNRAVVEASIESKGKVTATCRGVFVAVPPGHPAYHRW